MGFCSLGLLLPGRRHASAVPGCFAVYFRRAEKKFKVFRSAEIRTRNVLDRSEKVVSMVIETVSRIIV